MIEAILVWGVASIIFVNKFNYPVENALNAFYLMATAGLIIFDHRKFRKQLGRGFSKWSSWLKKAGYLRITEVDEEE